MYSGGGDSNDDGAIDDVGGFDINVVVMLTVVMLIANLIVMMI